MTDLKKDIEPVMDNAENTNPAITPESDFEIDLGDSSSEEQKSTDFSNIFSEEEKNGSNPDEKNEVSDPNERLDSFENNNDLFKDEPSESLDENNNLFKEPEQQPGISDDSGDSNQTVENLEDNNNMLNEAVQQPEISEDSSDSNQNTENLEDNNNMLNEAVQQPEISKFESSHEEHIDEKKLEEISSSIDEGGNSLSNQESSNNELILGKFENVMINTVNEKNLNKTEDISPIIEHPTVLENSQSLEESPIIHSEEQQKAKLAQKEKIAQLIKAHESKAQKTGFTKGILSGAILIIGIVLVSFIFAKDQIINLINEISPSLSANIVDVTSNTSDEEDNSNEVIDDEVIDDEVIDDEVIDDEVIDDEVIDDEVIDDEVIDDEVIDDEIIVDEVIDDEIIVDEVIDDEILDYSELTIDNGYTDNDLVEESKITITHVNSQEEANWVLPAHCSDLTCYGEDKEFTPCTTFRLAENLDENAVRIGNNGACRYKDSSELVYVEIK